MKHALWLQVLARLTAEQTPLTVIDTHAGAGLYDLGGEMARRSREAAVGIDRLIADDAAPSVFAPLKNIVRAANPQGGVRVYPGSPVLTVEALRPRDRYVGCELRADDRQTLQSLFDQRTRAKDVDAHAVLADGYQQLGRSGPRDVARLAVLVDPPFERGDDYQQLIAGVARELALRPDTVFAIWAPLKDLETFDALLRGLEALRQPSMLVAEARLRPLLDPMRMNGSAMILIGAPDLTAEASAICRWVVQASGEKGGEARVTKLGC